MDLATRDANAAFAELICADAQWLREEFDTLIAATGYLVDLPFLSEEILPARDNTVELYNRIVPPDWPGLLGRLAPVAAESEAASAALAEIDRQADGPFREQASRLAALRREATHEIDRLVSEAYGDGTADGAQSA